MKNTLSFKDVVKISVAGSLLGIGGVEAVHQIRNQFKTSITSTVQTRQNTLPQHTNVAEETVKALWVTRFQKIYDKDSIDTLLKFMQDEQMNTLLYQVYSGKSGETVFHSDVDKGNMSPYVKDNFDPLAYAVEEGHKRGIKVQAWMNALVTDKNMWENFPERRDWFLKNDDGTPYTDHDKYLWLNPGHAEVKKYIADLIVEVAHNYNIDGVHLDRVRFPAKKFVSQKSTNELTLFVNNLKNGLENVSKGQKLSAAVWGYHKGEGNLQGQGGVEKVGQDSLRWISDNCIERKPCIDQIMPMFYWRITDTVNTGIPRFQNTLESYTKVAPERVVMGYTTEPDAHVPRADNEEKIRKAAALGAGTALFAYNKKAPMQNGGFFKRK